MISLASLAITLPTRAAAQAAPKADSPERINTITTALSDRPTRLGRPAGDPRAGYRSHKTRRSAP